MSAQHTPGPWELHPNGGRVIKSRGLSYLTVANIQPRRHREESQANARLICAAPELRDALARLVAAYDRSDAATFDDLMGEARALLARVATDTTAGSVGALSTT